MTFNVQQVPQPARPFATERSQPRHAPIASPAGLRRSVNPGSAAGPSADGRPLTALIGSDMAGNVVTWSPTAQHLFGLRYDQVRGRQIEGLLGNGIPRDLLVQLRKMVVGGALYCRHSVLRLGQHIPVETTLTVAENPRGEREILSSTTPLRPGMMGNGPTKPALANLGAGLTLTYLISPMMVITSVGPGVRAILGQLPRDVIGRHFSSSVHPEDFAAWQRSWGAVLGGESPREQVDARMRAVNGSWVWMRHEITDRTADGQFGAIQVDVHSVEEVIQVERTRHVLEQTLISVLESSVEGVWITDENGATVFLNPRMTELLGMDSEEFEASSVGQVFGPDVASSTAMLAPALRAGSRIQHDIDHVDPTGRSRRLRVAITPRVHFDERATVAGVTNDRNAPAAVTAAGGLIVMCSELQAISPDTYLDGQLGAVLSPMVGGERHRATVRPTSAARLFDIEAIRLTVRDAVPSLTAREIEIVTRLCLGDRAPAIARALFISPSTVRNHLASVFRKAGVSTQQELIVFVRGSQRLPAPH